MVNTSTKANVPIIDVGSLGENDINVRIVMIRKYTLDTRLNCMNND